MRDASTAWRSKDNAKGRKKMLFLWFWDKPVKLSQRMNGVDARLIEASKHLGDDFLLTSALIVRHDDDRRLVAETAPQTLRTNDIGRRVIGKDSKLAIDKVGILVEDVDRSDMVDLLLVEPAVNETGILVLRVDAILAKKFSLLDGLAEGDGTRVLELKEDAIDNIVLEIGKILEPLATEKEPHILDIRLTGALKELFLIEDA